MKYINQPVLRTNYHKINDTPDPSLWEGKKMQGEGIWGYCFHEVIEDFCSLGAAGSPKLIWIGGTTQGQLV